MIAAGGGADCGIATPPYEGVFGGGMRGGQTQSRRSATGAVLHPAASNNNRPARHRIASRPPDRSPGEGSDSIPATEGQEHFPTRLGLILSVVLFCGV
jgi:hypothetical protein